MKVSQNFDVREFVPKETWDKWGEKSIWFIDPKIPKIAEFLKGFFAIHYKADSCLIIVNTYLFDKTPNAKHFRGYRPPNYTEGGKESQHRFGRGLDCDIILVNKGVRTEVNYSEIQKIIIEHEEEFMAAGITRIEDVAFAPTWLHVDCAWTGLDHILVVKP